MTKLRRTGLALLAPAIALVVTVIITTAIIVATGFSPAAFWSAMFDMPIPRVRVNIVNQTALIYLAAVSCAICFRMGLFNIGVEGQYSLAALVAAWFAGAGFLSGIPNVLASLVVASLVGAGWAGIAGILKVTRGVSEVISTIMLNSIALTLIGYMLNHHGVHERNTVHTPTVSRNSMLIGFTPFEPSDGDVWALIALAAAVGVLFWLVLSRTRFGFDLRASGQSQSAARASGINAKRMVVIAMLLSGAVAGLVWMPSLFGDAASFGESFQSGLGFTGIAVALLGRNRALGMVFGALLFAFLSAQANTLTQHSGVSPSIVEIIQGVAVLAVVIAYAVVRRWRTVLEQREVGRELEAATA